MFEGKLNRQNSFSAAVQTVALQDVINPAMKSTAIVANFPPEQSLSASEATKLTCHLVSQGVTVTTIAGPGRSVGNQKLNFHTRRRYKISRQRLELGNKDKYERVILFWGNILATPLLGTTVMARIWERIRRLDFIRNIGQSTPEIILVVPLVKCGVLKPIARFLFPGTSCRVVPLENCSTRLAASFTNSPIALVSYQEALEVFWHHTSLGNQKLYLKPSQILKRLRGSDPAAKDLAEIAHLAMNPQLATHPSVLRFMRSTPDADPIIMSHPPHRIADKINAPGPCAQTFDVPISNYMLFLRHYLKLETAFPLRTPTQAEDYAAWIFSNGLNLAPGQHLPLPAALIRLQQTEPGEPFTQQRTLAPRKAQLHNLARGVVQILNDPVNAAQLEPETISYLKQQPLKNSLSRFELLLSLLCQQSRSGHRCGQLWRSRDTASWFGTDICAMQPGLKVFSTQTSAPTSPAPPVLELIGLGDTHTGLGQNLRMSALAFEDIGLKPRLLDALKDLREIPIEPLSPSRMKRLKKAMVLHHVNADRIPLAMVAPRLMRRNDQYHVGYLLWELENLPEVHRLALDLLDEIWTPSEFVARIYRPHTSKPVIVMKKSIPDMSRLAQAAKSGPHFTCVVCFDFHSSVERKNPLAAVMGFLAAFPVVTHNHCRLIIKTTPLVKKHWGDPNNQMQQILDLARKDRRIQVIAENHSFKNLATLLARSDCVISTHRSEGFGYIPAYALSLGKPLVVTDYGGTQDFCTPRTCFPLAFTLVPVPDGHSIYPVSGARWADTNISEIAGFLTQIHNQPNKAQARATAGQILVRQNYSRSKLADRYQQRLQALGVL